MLKTVLVPLTQLVPKLQECGIHYPGSLHSARWMYRQRHENGFAAAFCEVNGRILVNVPKYVEIATRSA